MLGGVRRFPEAAALQDNSEETLKANPGIVNRNVPLSALWRELQAPRPPIIP